MKKESKTIWRKIFTILVLALFLGTTIAVAVVNIANRFILERTP